MFRPGFNDLAKPQWLAVVGALKTAGRLPVTELAVSLGASYMAAKDACEALRRLGYVERLRAPRRQVGRPEVFYRLTAKADRLFPEAGAGLTLELLEHARELFGETAPDRLLFRHFQRWQERWQPMLAKAGTLADRAAALCVLREREGHCCRCRQDVDEGLRIEEFHHPLAAVFARHPHAIGMELKMLESLLGTRVQRRETSGGPHGPARVDFLLSG
jgi:predicted ArsR family transcriptional regulator